jgi:adenosylcobinamide kinase / adenosylcobinamide-phosphate guanylyltransferase
MAQRTLIVGGARSGKSRLAENLVAAAPLVNYVAPGYLPGDDAEWAARVAAHQARRPATWLTRVLDAAGAWSQTDGWQDRLDAETDRLVAVWAACPATVVAVSNEVGLGVVPATPAGRLFRDLLGRLNQQIGTSADRLYLVVAGRALDLSAAIAI